MEPQESVEVSEPVNGHEVLEKLAALPISTWNYKWENASIRHLGSPLRRTSTPPAVLVGLTA